jgi:hypothetical protein
MKGNDALEALANCASEAQNGSDSYGSNGNCSQSDSGEKSQAPAPSPGGPMSKTAQPLFPQPETSKQQQQTNINPQNWMNNFAAQNTPAYQNPAATTAAAAALLQAALSQNPAMLASNGAAGPDMLAAMNQMAYLYYASQAAQAQVTQAAANPPAAQAKAPAPMSGMSSFLSNNQASTINFPPTATATTSGKFFLCYLKRFVRLSGREIALFDSSIMVGVSFRFVSPTWFEKHLVSMSLGQ